MPDMIEIGNVGSVGAISDVPAYELPPEAWTLIENMRIRNNGIERLPGREEVFGALPVAPVMGVPVRTLTSNLWVYTSLARAYVWDGANHTEITRLAGVYNALVPSDWNNTLFASILVVNNGVDVPQYWSTPTIATKLLNLANWPSTLRARVIRAVGPYLVALNIVDTGVSFPHMVQWSHPADPGSIPASWDYANPAVDAGRKDLEDVESGMLLDGLRLRSDLILYKESSIWRMSPIGGRFVFDFKTIFDTIGILATRCATITGEGRRHVVATQDADIVVHDGNSFDSILTKRQQERLAADIDTVNYPSSFMFTNAPFGEIWFCYPTQGNAVPNKALIWNYRENQKGVITEADGVDFVHAAPTNVELASEETWEDGEDEWEVDTGPWSLLVRRRLIVSNQVAGRFYVMDSGVTRAGSTYSATLQRTGLSVTGRKRTGEWVVDFEKLKMLSRMLPKIQGGPVRIRVGSQMTVDGPITWGDYIVFTPSTDVYANVMTTGRAIAIEFSTVDAVDWRLDSYKLLMNVLGTN